MNSLIMPHKPYRLFGVGAWLAVALLAYPVALFAPVLFPALFAALWVAAEVLTEARCKRQ